MAEPMPAVNPVRLAVIGAGTIGARHVHLAAAEPACRLVAVADPAPAAAALAKAAGVACYADFEEMLDRERPDGAIVAVPTALHAPVGLACVARGVHLLMEKPVAESVAAGRELVDAAARAGVRLAVGHHRRFDPAVEAARQIVGSGEIGRLLAVQATWALRKPDDYFEAAWRRYRGGGPVLINLIHDIDMLRHICGEIERVHAEAESGARGFEVEDTVAVVLRFRGGALGTVTASDAAPSPWGWEPATGDNPEIPEAGVNCYRFLGSAGALAFPRLEIWRHAGAGPGSWDRPIAATPRPLPARAALARQLSHFCQVVRGQAAPRVDGVDALATLAATVAILDSARRGKPVAPQPAVG
jgi:predicted dehydrogenase